MDVNRYSPVSWFINLHRFSCTMVCNWVIYHLNFLGEQLIQILSDEGISEVLHSLHHKQLDCLSVNSISLCFKCRFESVVFPEKQIKILSQKEIPHMKILTNWKWLEHQIEILTVRFQATLAPDKPQGTFLPWKDFVQLFESCHEKSKHQLEAQTLGHQFGTIFHPHESLDKQSWCHSDRKQPESSQIGTMQAGQNAIWQHEVFLVHLSIVEELFQHRHTNLKQREESYS